MNVKLAIGLGLLLVFPVSAYAEPPAADADDDPDAGDDDTLPAQDESPITLDELESPPSQRTSLLLGPSVQLDGTPLALAPDPPAEPPTEISTWNAPLFLSGALAFTLSYGTSVLVAGVSDRREDDRLYVPVLGPWLDLDERGDCPVRLRSCDQATTARVLLVTDGLIQGAAVVTMVVALLSPTRYTVPARTAVEGTRWAPIATGGMTGLGVSGTF